MWLDASSSPKEKYNDTLARVKALACDLCHTNEDARTGSHLPSAQERASCAHNFALVIL